MMGGDKKHFTQTGKSPANLSLSNARECVIKQKHKISCSNPCECVHVLVEFAPEGCDPKYRVEDLAHANSRV
jgi:hypothetical protein